MENIYEEIGKRTDGNIYLAVAGPVRTGKSTFVKRFMEELVIPSSAMDSVPILTLMLSPIFFIIELNPTM